MLLNLVKKHLSGLLLLILLSTSLYAQEHPWRANTEWAKMPGERTWGSTSAVYPGQDGTMWVGERCGQIVALDRKMIPSFSLIAMVML